MCWGGGGGCGSVWCGGKVIEMVFCAVGSVDVGHTVCPYKYVCTKMPQ